MVNETKTEMLCRSDLSMFCGSGHIKSRSLDALSRFSRWVFHDRSYLPLNCPGCRPRNPHEIGSAEGFARNRRSASRRTRAESPAKRGL